jgi:hypothetical protein
MSDDTQQEKPIQPEGEAIPLAELLALFDVNQQSINDAIDWWDTHATDEFVGALE